MKNILKAAVLTGLLVMAGGQQIQAQQAQRAISFRAPFAFQVENTKLPAGQYIILEQTGWIQIQAKDGKGKTQVLTLPVTSRDHSMRHGAASSLLADGATPAVVQRQLRHSDARITLGIYGHVIGDEQRTVVQNRSKRLVN